MKMITIPERKELLAMERELGTVGTWVRLGEMIAQQIPGVYVNESKTTNSVYIGCIGWADEVRISDHTKYGSNVPMNIQLGNKGKAKWPELIDRAVRAAITGARRYQDVKKWSEIETVI